MTFCGLEMWQNLIRRIRWFSFTILVLPLHEVAKSVLIKRDVISLSFFGFSGCGINVLLATNRSVFWSESSHVINFEKQLIAPRDHSTNSDFRVRTLINDHIYIMEILYLNIKNNLAKPSCWLWYGWLSILHRKLRDIVHDLLYFNNSFL